MMLHKVGVIFPLMIRYLSLAPCDLNIATRTDKLKLGTVSKLRAKWKRELFQSFKKVTH